MVLILPESQEDPQAQVDLGCRKNLWCRCPALYQCYDGGSFHPARQERAFTVIKEKYIEKFCTLFEVKSCWAISACNLFPSTTSALTVSLMIGWHWVGEHLGWHRRTHQQIFHNRKSHDLDSHERGGAKVKGVEGTAGVEADSVNSMGWISSAAPGIWELWSRGCVRPVA